MMVEDESQTNCVEFQNQLGELIATGVDVSSHPHVIACELCRQLIRDLDRIAKDAGHGRFGARGE
jgi:hypothetical protein